MRRGQCETTALLATAEHLCSLRSPQRGLLQLFARGEEQNGSHATLFKKEQLKLQITDCAFYALTGLLNHLLKVLESTTAP